MSLFSVRLVTGRPSELGNQREVGTVKVDIGVVEEITVEIGGAYTVLGIAWNDFKGGGGRLASNVVIWQN